MMSAPGARAAGQGSIELSSGWRAAVADETLRRSYPSDAFDDSVWPRIKVPGHWRTQQGFEDTDGPVLYRKHFEKQPLPGTRSWLVIDGVMYTSDVWLDGVYLGDTEGWFFPHCFEITDLLVNRSEHLLAMEVASTPPSDRAHKHNLTGIFEHWDAIDQSWNPGGIWCTPLVQSSGPVRIKHFRALCRAADTDSATIALRAVLDAAEATSITFETSLIPLEHRHRSPSAHGDLIPQRQRQQHRRYEHELANRELTGPGAAGAETSEHAPPGEAPVQRITHSLAAGENRVEWTYTEPRPRLWWPWSLGDQPLYELCCRVRLGDGSVSDERTRRLGLRSITAHNFVFEVNGQRIFLKGSNHAPTRLALADATAEEVTRDLDLARGANLDFLRVHAHIARPELYDEADRTGMLVWQDMPLQWGYARSVRKQARRQAREAVDLLAHHPSIFTWCAHNEPLAIDVTPDALADPASRAKLTRRAAALMMLPTWNKTILDRSIKRVLEKCDGSRPVVAHSGVLPHPPQLEGTDTHTYFGWYHGAFRQFPNFLAAWPRTARFVSEFGAQAAPLDAPWLDTLHWPDLDWNGALHKHALQKTFFDRYVPPARFETYAAWAEATQRYQADLIKCHVESLRKIAYEPCGGFAQFCLADCQPAVTWSVLDQARQPKLAYATLRDSCAPLIIVADWMPETLLTGQMVALDVHVVNGERTRLDDLVADIVLHCEQPGTTGRSQAPGSEPPTATSSAAPGRQGEGSRWRFAGGAPADTVTRVGTVSFVTPDHPARLILDLELSGDGRLARNRYETQVRPS